MPPYCQLCGYLDELNFVNLLLDGVHVDVFIVDVHAKAIMSQKFTNTFESAVEATYTFSMLANSAVCGFEMVRGDGTKVEGHVMEKKAAKKAYDAAKQEGKAAGLGENQTDDLFTIKVGNISPTETVTINVTFLIPLTDDEKRDQIRFTFPRAYGERYGAPPTPEAANISSTTGASQNFSINVLVQQASSIKSISCPSSHPIELFLGKSEGVSTDPSVPDSNLASVKMLSPTTFLTQDFILVITATGLDAPRCFVEPSLDGKTTAIGMTFVPRFKLPDVKGGMEYIFVVDRSGSMDGLSIKLVRQALIVLLRGLPSKGTRFNIVSFGSYADSLWSTSKDYSQGSLEEATAHVDTMEANYGGTEIGAALKLVYESLPEKRQAPVAVFVLTDGETWDIDTCKDLTTAALASPGPFVRVFTVGIGDAVSTNTTESIARAGGGIAIYVQDNEPMTGKLARLVRASRTPPITDLKVIWPADNDSGDDLEVVEPGEGDAALQAPQKYNLVDETADEGEASTGPPPKPDIRPTDVPIPAIQQAPLVISGLFPGTRINIFAIISSSALQANHLRQPIRVCGKVSDTQDTVELAVDVTRSLSPSDSSPPLIHTLAARALVTDREDGKHTFQLAISSKPSLLEAYLEAEIVRLGTTYGLTSRHTSYIAIDERHPEQPLGPGTIEYTQELPSTGVSVVQAVSARLASVPAAFSYMQPMAGSILRSDEEYCAEALEVSANEEYRVEASDAYCEDEGVPLDLDDLMAPLTQNVPAIQETEDPGLTGLARLQRFDGSFTPSDRLFQLLGIPSKLSGAPPQADTDAMTTALALLWMKRESAEDGEDMIAKAEEWLQDYVGEEIYLELLEWAKTMFA